MLGSSLAVLAIATGLILNALRDSIVFFTTPTMAAEKAYHGGQALSPRQGWSSRAPWRA